MMTRLTEKECLNVLKEYAKTGSNISLREYLIENIRLHSILYGYIPSQMSKKFLDERADSMLNDIKNLVGSIMRGLSK